MREFKFRAWDKENKVMVNDIGILDGRAIDRAIKTYDTPNTEIDFHIDWELMQFTGLKDKNEKEIYEGDILEFIKEHKELCECEHCFEEKIGTRMIVIWDEDGFYLYPAKDYKEFYGKKGNCIRCNCYEHGLFSPNHEIEIGCYTKIIGNIYENPDLLK